MYMAGHVRSRSVGDGGFNF